VERMRREVISSRWTLLILAQPDSRARRFPRSDSLLHMERMFGCEVARIVKDVRVAASAQGAVCLVVRYSPVCVLFFANRYSLVFNDQIRALDYGREYK
jgi:hypothetical protein